MLYMASMIIPDSMASKIKRIGKSEISLSKLIDYTLFTFLVFMNVTIYHLQGETKIFEYVVLANFICFIISVVSFRFLKSSPAVTSVVVTELIWLLWILYSSLFNDTDRFYNEDAQFIQGALLIISYISTYFKKIKTSEMNLLLVLIFMLALTAMPHIYSNFFTLTIEMAYLKTLIFLLSFIAMDNNEELILSNEACSFQIKIIRIIWVLFVHKYYLIFSILLFIPFLSFLFKEKEREINLLPLHNSDIKIESTENNKKEKLRSILQTNGDPVKEVKKKKKLVNNKSQDKNGSSPTLPPPPLPVTQVKKERKPNILSIDNIDIDKISRVLNQGK
jgi:hypothetical protein